ncbi:MAG TPA: peptidylprolyl isomerase [Allosphingosinicella sp.]|jgi:peptidyl-prolyl cis-trans isomerase SurA
MKLGWLARAAIVMIAPVLSVVAAAQSGGGNSQSGLNIPDNPQFLARQEPGVRKATAIVNGDVITESDIDQRLALFLASNRAELPPEQVARIRAQVFRNLIDESIQIQTAVQQEITVSDQDVNSYYERFAQGFRQTPAQFSAYLRSVGSSERSLKRQIRGEISWQRVQRRNVDPFVTVGDQEVEAVLERVRASQGTTEYHVAEIWLSATPETANEVRANVVRLIEQIRNGGNFSAFARQFSEATTAAVGGDLGWLRAEQLPAELSALAIRMPIGSVSDPIPVGGGFSIILLVDSRRLGLADPRDAMLSLMQMSLAMPAGTTAAQAQARGQALGAATQAMGGCGGAAATAQRVGGELISNDQVRVRDLPPALQQMLLGLAVGQATPPFGSAERVSVLVLCGRDDPAPTTAPSFDTVSEQIREERLGRRAQRYLRDLRRDAVIDYR